MRRLRYKVITPGAIMLHVYQHGDLKIQVDPAKGARLAALEIGDLNLLVPAEPNPWAWGSYVMAPWAGRIRNQSFSFGKRSYQLPVNMPPHAIHGTVSNKPWLRCGQEPVYETELGPDWPFAGRVRQHYLLHDDALEMRLEIHTEGEPFPASCGWHPWFLRDLGRGGPAQLSFKARAMYQRDAENLVDGHLTDPCPGPWDDCFIDLQQPLQLEWPGALRLSLESDTRHWVIYDLPRHALCVEPWTGPPDALNLEPRIVTREQPLCARFRITWEKLKPGP